MSPPSAPCGSPPTRTRAAPPSCANSASTRAARAWGEEEVAEEEVAEEVEEEEGATAAAEAEAPPLVHMAGEGAANGSDEWRNATEAALSDVVVLVGGEHCARSEIAPCEQMRHRRGSATRL